MITAKPCDEDDVDAWVLPIETGLTLSKIVICPRRFNSIGDTLSVTSIVEGVTFDHYNDANVDIHGEHIQFLRWQFSSDLLHEILHVS